MSPIFTIGFTKKSAKEFFELLQIAGVKKVLDVRLNNVSQLAGFSKKEDLEYFLKCVAGIDYQHETLLAPTQDMLDDYKHKKGAWDDFARRFHTLIEEREIERKLNPDELAGACLLCSEDKSHQCHRRLVVEYLQKKWGKLEIVHL